MSGQTKMSIKFFVFLSPEIWFYHPSLQERLIRPKTKLWGTIEPSDIPTDIQKYTSVRPSKSWKERKTSILARPSCEDVHDKTLKNEKLWACSLLPITPPPPQKCPKCKKLHQHSGKILKHSRVWVDPNLRKTTCVDDVASLECVRNRTLRTSNTGGKVATATSNPSPLATAIF